MQNYHIYAATATCDCEFSWAGLFKPPLPTTAINPQGSPHASRTAARMRRAVQTERTAQAAARAQVVPAAAADRVVPARL